VFEKTYSKGMELNPMNTFILQWKRNVYKLKDEIWIKGSVSARGASCRHLTERPELEPRASKKINNSRGRELLSLEMTKRKKDKEIPLLEGQRILVGLFSPPAKRVPVTESVLPTSLGGGGGARGARAWNWGSLWWTVVTWRAVQEQKEPALLMAHFHCRASLGLVRYG